MNPKQIDVECPCCSTILTIDVLTSKVLRRTEARESDATGKPVLDEKRWDDANSRVQDRRDVGQDHFDAALNKEQNRSKDLDSLFDQLNKKAGRPRDEEA